MDAISAIIGVFAACVILALLNQIISEKHPILKIFIVFFILFLLIIIPRVLIESKHTCEVVVATSNTVNSTATQYEYTTYCYDQDYNSPSTFLKIVLWLYRILASYVVIYMIYYGGNTIVDHYRGKK